MSGAIPKILIDMILYSGKIQIKLMGAETDKLVIISTNDLNRMKEETIQLYKLLNEYCVNKFYKK